MKVLRALLAYSLLLILTLACNYPTQSANIPFVFPTPVFLFPSVTPSPTQPEPTATLTPDPTPTPREWPPPFFGTPGPPPVTPVPTPFPDLTAQEAVTFLLIGSDKRSSSSFRTDTLIVVNFQPRHKLVTLISIPRDLYVYIPGWTMNRVNTAYLHGDLSRYPGGGAGLLKDTLLYNLGIRVDYTAMVNFNGFRKIIDTLGGIDVPLACPYTDWHIIDPDESAQDEDNWKLLTLGPGVVHMDGDLALWYARSRLRSSDYDRGRRQQEVLRAIYSQAIHLGAIARLPELYVELRDSLETDISLDDLRSLAPLAAELGSARIRSYYINKDLTDGWRTPTGGSVLLPDGAAIHAMLEEALGPPDEQESQHLDIVVEIWNGTQNSNWDTLAAERLHYGGYETQVALADQRNHAQTMLYDFTTEQDLERSTAILSLLGLPASRLVNDARPTSPIGYRLVLGSDYKPCFNPAKIAR